MKIVINVQKRQKIKLKDKTKRRDQKTKKKLKKQVIKTLTESEQDNFNIFNV